VIDLLRAKEVALRAQQAAQSRAALSKALLDDEMDSMRNRALATIVETELA